MNKINKQTTLSCSVIIPAFNSAAYISQALNSLLNQSRQPDEILVIDNNSTDETTILVDTFAAPVQLLSEPRQGASFARNRGIEAATGEIIAFLDADDISLPQRIEKKLQIFKDYPHIDLVFSAMSYTDANLQPTQSRARCDNFHGESFFGQLLERNRIGSTSVAMARKSALLEVGGFDVTITHNEEYDLWLRLAETRHVLYVDEVLVHYRLHSDNISHQREAQRCNEKKALLKHSLQQIKRALTKTYPDEICRQELAFARILLRRGELQAATDQLMALGQKNADATFFLGVCLQLNDKLDEAKHAYRTCLQLNGNRAEALNNLGVLLATNSDTQEAEHAFTAAKGMRPYYSDPQVNLQIIKTKNYDPRTLHSTLNTLRTELKPD